VYCKKLWLAEAILIYQPLPAPAHLRGAYTPPAVQTYTNLIKSPAILKQMAERFELVSPDAVKLLEKEVQVNQLKGPEMFAVGINWPDRDEAARFVNELVELFQEKVRTIRRDKILRDSVSVTRQSLEDHQSKVRNMELYIIEYKNRILTGKPLGSMAEIALDGPSEVRKKKLTDDLRKYDSEVLEAMQQRSTATAEFAAQKALKEKGAGAPFEYEKAKNALELAKLRVENIQRQIRDADEERRLIPVEFTGEQLVKLDHDTKELATVLAALEKWQRQNANPSAEPELAPDEMNRLVQQFVGVDESEFKVDTRALGSPYPSSSNRKLLTAVAFACPMVLVFFVTAIRDQRSQTGSRPSSSVLNPTPIVLPSPTSVAPPKPVYNSAKAEPPPQQESLLDRLRKQKMKPSTPTDGATIPAPATPTPIPATSAASDSPETDTLRDWVKEARGSGTKAQ